MHMNNALDDSLSVRKVSVFHLPQRSTVSSTLTAPAYELTGKNEPYHQTGNNTPCFSFSRVSVNISSN